MYPVSPNGDTNTTLGVVTVPKGYPAISSSMHSSTVPVNVDVERSGMANAKNAYLSVTADYSHSSYAPAMSVTPNRISGLATGQFMPSVVAPTYRVHPPSPQSQAHHDQQIAGTIVYNSHPTTPSYTTASTGSETSPYLTHADRSLHKSGFSAVNGARQGKQTLSGYQSGSIVQDLLTPQSLLHNRSLAQLSSGPQSDHSNQHLHPSSNVYNPQSPSLSVTPADYLSQSPNSHGVGVPSDQDPVTSVPMTVNHSVEGVASNDHHHVSVLGLVPGSRLSQQSYDGERLAQAFSVPYRRSSIHAAMAQPVNPPSSSHPNHPHYAHHQQQPQHQQQQLVAGVPFSVPPFTQQQPGVHQGMPVSRGMGGMSNYSNVGEHVQRQQPIHHQPHLQLPQGQQQQQQQLPGGQQAAQQVQLQPRRTANIKSQRRVEQNRRAQRAFRDRKRRYVESLQTKADELEAQVHLVAHLRTENAALTALAKSLKIELNESEKKVQFSDFELENFVKSYCVNYANEHGLFANHSLAESSCSAATGQSSGGSPGERLSPTPSLNAAEQSKVAKQPYEYDNKADAEVPKTK